MERGFRRLFELTNSGTGTGTFVLELLELLIHASSTGSANGSFQMPSPLDALLDVGHNKCFKVGGVGAFSQSFEQCVLS